MSTPLMTADALRKYRSPEPWEGIVRSIQAELLEGGEYAMFDISYRQNRSEDLAKLYRESPQGAMCKDVFPPNRCREIFADDAVLQAETWLRANGYGATYRAYATPHGIIGCDLLVTLSDTECEGSENMAPLTDSVFARDLGSKELSVADPQALDGGLTDVST